MSSGEQEEGTNVTYARVKLTGLDGVTTTMTPRIADRHYDYVTEWPNDMHARPARGVIEWHRVHAMIVRGEATAL